MLNMFLKIGTSLLAADGNEWYDIIGKAVDNIIGPALIILCSIGIIYAIVIGVKMMKAEDKNAREENKARLINLAISIIAIVALIALFYSLRSWLGKSENQKKITGNDLTSSNYIGQTLRILFRR